MHDKDDPFFDMDDEHTIIKPNPRGRRQNQPSRPQRSGQPGKKVDLSNRPGLNPLEKSASVLLNLLSQIRNTSSHPNSTGLHKQLATEIQNFESTAQREGIPPETIFIARYALCTVIDEFVMSTPWGASSIWSTQSLLSLFHKETRGGERFFQMLNKLNQNPAKNIDLLELLYLCLSLGFQGRYRVATNGINELEEIRESLYYTIRQQHEEPEPALSPHWEGMNKSAVEKTVLVPAWLAACIAILLLVGLFSLWRFSLGDQYRSSSRPGNEYRPGGIPVASTSAGTPRCRLHCRSGPRKVWPRKIPRSGDSFRPGHGEGVTRPYRCFNRR